MAASLLGSAAAACGDDTGTGGASSSSATGCPGGCGGEGGAGGDSEGKRCTSSAECLPIEVCEFVNDECGRGGFLGTCVDRPENCPIGDLQLCGCDGRIYGSRCEAMDEGIDISVSGGCTPPEGTFACGPTFCEIGVEYCWRTLSDAGASPDAFACSPLPAACAAEMPPTCACLAAEAVPCGATCEALPSGQPMVTCMGS
jgi:hypothetical protein